MSPLLIRCFPDPILKQPTRTVERVDALVVKLIDALIATMRSHPRCVGLAAPQVGSPLRVAVMDATGHPKVEQSHGLIVLVNPRIEVLEEFTVGREGCLSIPDLTANVRRARRVRLTARNQAGSPFACWLEGFEAVVVQHEVDHLDGALFLDRVTDVRADVFPRKTYLSQD